MKKIVWVILRIPIFGFLYASSDFHRILEKFRTSYNNKIWMLNIFYFRNIMYTRFPRIFLRIYALTNFPKCYFLDSEDLKVFSSGKQSVYKFLPKYNTSTNRLKRMMMFVMVLMVIWILYHQIQIPLYGRKSTCLNSKTKF